MKLAVDFILVIGILLSLFAVGGVLRIKDKTRPHYILATFWFLIFNVFLYFYATLHELVTLQFLTNFLENGVRFFIPPLIYLYVKSIFNEDPHLIKKNLIHFVVFFVHLFIYVIPKSIDSASNYIYIIYELIPNWGLVQDVFGIVYFTLSLRLFYKASNLIKQSYSSLTEKDFLWIEKFLISFLLVLIVDLIITVSEIVFGYRVDWDAFITVFFTLVAMSYLGYYGFGQSTVFVPQFLLNSSLETATKRVPEQTRYIRGSEKIELTEKFEFCMLHEKMYLSPNLNLSALAECMEISERKLSAFLSEVLEQSFYDAVNSYRVDEAKMMLTSNAVEKQTIEGIGSSCGFSSKSSFYRIFKKNTGKAPLAYRASTINESHHT